MLRQVCLMIIIISLMRDIVCGAGGYLAKKL